MNCNQWQHGRRGVKTSDGAGRWGRRDGGHQDNPLFAIERAVLCFVCFFFSLYLFVNMNIYLIWIQYWAIGHSRSYLWW